jgi:hypothetical protein
VLLAVAGVSWHCWFIMNKMMSALRYGILGALAVVFSCFSAEAAEMTAFKLIKEGNRYIGEQAKDKVVQIRSEKSVGELSPNIWFVVYYDATASLKATEVKFGAGKMQTVKRPMRLLEPVLGGDQPLALEKLKVDSDRAIAVALKEPLLAKLKVVATELTLEKAPKDLAAQTTAGEGVWKVRLWAEKLRNPAKTVDVGVVWVSADSGKVLGNDLKIARVD